MNYSNTTIENENVRIALVAEDDDMARVTLARHLRAEGYGVLEARTSIEALLLAVEFPDRIDVLFTSPNLIKYCNGVELAGCLRVSRPEMAVIYLSGEGDRTEDADQEILEGEALSLEKPLNLRELDAILAAVTCRNFSDTSLETIDRT